MKLETLFGFTAPVSRRLYAQVGFSLMALKLAGDQFFLRWLGGSFLNPLEMLSLLRLDARGDLGPWTVQALGLWALPFAWIGLSMTMRRAYDAGASPWLGLLFCVPLFNFALMLCLCIAPTRPRKVPAGTTTAEARDRSRSRLESALRAMGAAFVVVLVTVGLTLMAGDSNLGGVFFIGLPLALGALVGFLYNRTGPRKLLSETLLLASGALLGSALLLVLFAFEGLICLTMAFPFALPLTLFGAALGRAMAWQDPHTPSPAIWVMVLLPLLAWAEPQLQEAPVRKVTTSVVIQAPPEVVWDVVLAFPPLPEPEEMLFHLGIAYPTHARLDGEGVGAVRYCEFSTGSFVEPITVWDPPRRLAFDVTEQPEPLKEMSPYRDLHLDHLAGTLSSRRGEFLLIEEPDGTTRLQGTTWYELSLGPEAYWALWTDPILRAIHLRVLRHIAEVSEAKT